MTKIKQQKRDLSPLDLRAQDHYEELLTISEVAQLSGFSKQLIYQQLKSNALRFCLLREIRYVKYRYLRAWFVKLSPAAIELLGKPQKKGLVFPNLTEYKLSFYIPRLLKLAKIEKHITFHCFRHTFAMRLLENGVDIYTIATLLGHKSVTSTQVYARLSPAQIRQAVMKL